MFGWSEISNGLNCEFAQSGNAVEHGYHAHVVTHSVAKVFLGSSKTRQAILTERLTSFWA